jgi:hypothetical protein
MSHDQKKTEHIHQVTYVFSFAHFNLFSATGDYLQWDELTEMQQTRLLGRRAVVRFVAIFPMTKAQEMVEIDKLT